MKNFVKEGQKLPLYGVGPYIVCVSIINNAKGLLTPASFNKHRRMRYGVEIYDTGTGDSEYKG